MKLLRDAIEAAILRRKTLLGDSTTTACRLFHGEADGIKGLFLERYGPGAILIRHEGKLTLFPEPRTAGAMILELLQPHGVHAIYDKPFLQDRSKLGGNFESILTDPNPLAGKPLPEQFMIMEQGRRFLVRLYDGFSVGLFLDQRENRTFLSSLAEGKAVLNTFAYTGGFSVACALAGATTTTVDVSARYLDWSKQNFAINEIDPEQHSFARMDTFEYFRYAARKGIRYDLIILDPPTFSAGNKRRGIPPFSAVRDYPKLIQEAAARLKPGGRIFASTNCAELCDGSRLTDLITQALPRRPRFLNSAPIPADFPGSRDRAHWRYFALD